MCVIWKAKTCALLLLLLLTPKRFRGQKSRLNVAKDPNTLEFELHHIA